MAYKTLSTAIGQAGAGYMRGRQYREQVEREEEERRLREQQAALQLELRRMLALKPTETSYGTVSPIDTATQGPAWMPATMETPMERVGWQTIPRTQPKKLTARQKAELNLEFDKKLLAYKREQGIGGAEVGSDVGDLISLANNLMSNIRQAERDRYKIVQSPWPDATGKAQVFKIEKPGVAQSIAGMKRAHAALMKKVYTAYGVEMSEIPETKEDTETETETSEGTQEFKTLHEAIQYLKSIDVPPQEITEFIRQWRQKYAE